MFRDRKVLALIPARGGSKRIPGKNIVSFHGKPLIAHTIDAARQCSFFDDVVVSTDSEEIATISRQCGARVPFLRDSKADDHSPVSEATIHALGQLEEAGERFDLVVQLFAVCPLRTAQDIVDALEFFFAQRASFLISCYRFGWMNPWWSMTLDEDFRPTWLLRDKILQRSQDLSFLYAPTGAIWIANVRRLVEAGTFYGPGHLCWELPWDRAIDIDSVEDIEMAELIYQRDAMRRANGASG